MWSSPWRCGPTEPSSPRPRSTRRAALGPRHWASLPGRFSGHSDFVYAVAYTPDGRHLLTAGKDRTIKRIDVRTLKEERTYSGHDQDVMALAVHPDGKRFVSAGEEPQIRWWTLDGDKPIVRDGAGMPAPFINSRSVATAVG